MVKTNKVYITKSKVDEIIQKFRINRSNLARGISDTDLYKWTLSLHERQYLSAYKAIISNPVEVL